MDLGNKPQQEAPQQASAPAEVVSEDSTETGTKALDLQDVKKTFFKPSQLKEAEIAIQAAMEACQKADGMQVWNFNPETDEIPKNYGIVIQPINQRLEEGKGTIVIGVGIGAVPTLDAIQEEKTGGDWVVNTIENAVMAKFANAIRPKADGETSGSVPFSIEDFITSQRAEGVLVAYRKLAKSFIEFLRKKGLKLMNEQLLRQVLQSAAFAEQHFPSIAQDVWNTILDKMIAAANKEDMAPGMLVEWKDTRATAGLPKIDEIKVDDFDF